MVLLSIIGRIGDFGNQGIEVDVILFTITPSDIYILYLLSPQPLAFQGQITCCPKGLSLDQRHSKHPTKLNLRLPTGHLGLFMMRYEQTKRGVTILAWLLTLQTNRRDTKRTERNTHGTQVIHWTFLRTPINTSYSSVMKIRLYYQVRHQDALLR